MQTHITNIQLIGDRFQVFAHIMGNDEVNTFMPGVTAQDIKNWVAERIAYYELLKEQELALQQELLNIEL